MNNKEFVNALSQKMGISATETEKLVNGMNSAIVSRLDDGDSVNVYGFGSFEVKKRMERVSVNPKTGKRSLIPPKLTLSYKPSTLLKDKFK